jgi:hypothetical protein
VQGQPCALGGVNGGTAQGSVGLRNPCFELRLQRTERRELGARIRESFLDHVSALFECIPKICHNEVYLSASVVHC